MSFFPLPYRCTIQRGISTTDRAGQSKISSYAFVATPKCLYLETSGGKVATSGEAFEGIVAFYVEPRVDIREGDHIINIADKKGNVIEPGPYEVLSVKKVPGLVSSAVHHQSCKLRGVSNVRT